MTLALPETGALDDAELAVAAARGDRSAFAAIYDRYADRLYDFCAGMLRDSEGAADCVQDVFVDAATQLGALRDPSRLRSWLYAIARNHALARIRARKREMPSDDLPDVDSGDPDMATIVARSELAELIAEACGALSERDRAVFELTYRHGLDGHELAEALGVSHTNANTLTGRLRDGVERSLGALLVCRGVQADPTACPELAALLEGWDGKFTVLMRKRVARHIDGCPGCDAERIRRVNPVALLGGLPVFIPAPALLRDRTLSEAELGLPAPGGPAPRLSATPPRHVRNALIAVFVVLGIAGVAQLLVPLRAAEFRDDLVTTLDATESEAPGTVRAFTASPSRPDASRAPATLPTAPPDEPTTAITNAPTTVTEQMPTTRAPGPTSTTRPNSSFEPSRRPETSVLRTTEPETSQTSTSATSTVTSTSSSTSSSSSSSSSTTSTTTSDPIE